MNTKYAGTRIIFSDTEKSNWTWDDEAQAYYWHRFFSHQPDLNFANPAVKRALEGLLHPMIREESARRIAAASAPYVVHVVPLLIESKEPRRRSLW